MGEELYRRVITWSVGGMADVIDVAASREEVRVTWIVVRGDLIWVIVYTAETSVAPSCYHHRLVHIIATCPSAVAVAVATTAYLHIRNVRWCFHR